MPLRTAVYLRRSSHDREDKQVHSIERQREDILQFLDKYNGTVASPAEQLTSDPVKDFYVEDASAKIVGRKEFNRMVEILKKRHYDVLLCAELSRLSRNAVDNGVLVQLLEDGHLKIIRTMDHVFRDTPTDKFTLALFLTVSKYENDQRAMNTRSGLKLRRSAGATTFKAPMGYINAGTEKGRKWVEGDEENFERVQRLWDLFRTGSYTFKTLTDEALATGVTVLGAKGERKPPALFCINMYPMKNSVKNGSKTSLLTFMLALTLNGCVTQYSSENEAFLHKKECASYQDDIQKQIDEINAQGTQLFAAGGQVFYSSEMNTCIAIKVLGVYPARPASEGFGEQVQFIDVLTGVTVKTFNDIDFADSNGNVDMVAYKAAWKAYAESLGISYSNS